MKTEPDRPLPPESRRRVLRAALLRPWNILVLVIGTFFFATTLAWWMLPLTLATYAALVALAVRDPIFQTLVLEGRDRAREVARSRVQRAVALSPEQRARRLRRGEVRDRLEVTLEARKRVLLAIEESGEPARTFLSGAATRLDKTAALLVDLAEARARAANKGPSETLAAADAVLSEIPEELDSLRSRVIRYSIEDSQGASDRSGELEESVEEINRRLQELRRFPGLL